MGAAFDYFLVFVVGAFAGGWTIPVGISLGLEPIGVLLTTRSGAVVATIVGITLGGKGREAIVARFGVDAEQRVTEGRAGAIVDRWGLPGLASVGQVVLGPTVTLLAALVFDLGWLVTLRWPATTGVQLFGRRSGSDAGPMTREA